MMPRVILATCREWPQGNDDIRALAHALGGEYRPWQEIVPADCRDARVVPLAAWDYSDDPQAYRNWLDALQAAGAVVCNTPALQRWNMDKRYLLALQALGLPVTPGVALLPGEDWAARIVASGWDNAVVKPLIGQSGKGVRRVQDHLPQAREYPHGALLQPFVYAPFGEVCLIYVAGRFSHAVRRQPAEGEWRANSAYGVTVSPIAALSAWRTCAEAVLAHVPEPPLYARVDGLVGEDGALSINDVVLIEPALYLQADAQALPCLCAAIAASPQNGKGFFL